MPHSVKIAYVYFDSHGVGHSEAHHHGLNYLYAGLKNSIVQPQITCTTHTILEIGWFYLLGLLSLIKNCYKTLNCPVIVPQKIRISVHCALKNFELN